MKTVRVTLLVTVDEAVVEKNYSGSIADYLNECTFSGICPETGKDIVDEVEEYDNIDDYDIPDWAENEEDF